MRIESSGRGFVESPAVAEQNASGVPPDVGPVERKRSSKCYRRGIDLAIADLEEGLKISPHYGKAHNNLAAYYAGMQQYENS